MRKKCIFIEKPLQNNIFLDIIQSCGLIAQSVEQKTENLRVGGSIPPQATTYLSLPISQHISNPYRNEARRFLSSQKISENPHKPDNILMQFITQLHFLKKLVLTS